MAFLICDRCGDVAIGNNLCRCATPSDPMAARRRHGDAVARAEARKSAHHHAMPRLGPKKAA